jgi:hypothetical protein
MFEMQDFSLPDKGALLGVATTKVQTLLEEALPGFQNEYEKVQSDLNQSRSARVTEFETPMSGGQR